MNQGGTDSFALALRMNKQRTHLGIPVACEQANAVDLAKTNNLPFKFCHEGDVVWPGLHG
jgi:hypothetical protein